MVFLVDLLIGFAQLDHPLGGHVRVLRGTILPLDLVKGLLKVLMIDADDDIAEHVDQSPVGVAGKPLVAGRLGESADRLVVEPQIQDRVHHSRHRNGSATADGDQERVLLVPELLPVSFSSTPIYLLSSSMSVSGRRLPFL